MTDKNTAITRDEIANAIHETQCGCEIGIHSAQGHQLPPINYSNFADAADAVSALLASRSQEQGNQ